jgi:hypothetical protein
LRAPKENAVSLGPTISFVIRSIKLCIFPLASSAVGVAALALLPQGTEVLRTINDNGLWHPESDDFSLVVAFTVSLSLWSLSNWYASRLLLQRDFDGAGAGMAARHTGRFIDQWRAWFPRLLVPAGILPIAGALAGQGQVAVAALEAGLAVALFSFVVLRRHLIAWVARRMHAAAPMASRIPATRQRSDLPEGEELMLWLAGALALVVFVLLARINYSFARWLGGASIMLLALGAIALFASLALIYWPRLYRWPPLTSLAIVAALVFGTLRVTANHGIAARRVDADAQTRVSRPASQDHLRAWVAANAPGANDPIILVAAEGGASRSAWWSAHVLGVLDDMSQGRFGQQVFAASGISGGSLGVATWVALQRDRRDRLAATGKGAPAAPAAPAAADATVAGAYPSQAACEGELRNAPSVVQSACFLGRDFVAPVLGYMLGVDLAQRFIPVPVATWDRSQGLENTWAQDWQALFKTRAFDCPLLDLYSAAPAQPVTGPPVCVAPQAFRVDIPVLLLNTATVDRGRPAVQTPVRMPDAEVDDLLDPSLRTAGLTVAGAVHNSARFPYVSPGGDVQSTSGEHFDSLVDGGYVENSGALGLAALMRSLRAAPEWQDWRKRLLVVFIANDPLEPVRSARQLCQQDAQRLDLHARKPWGEAVTPAIGLFNARSGRADTSRRALVRDLGLCEENQDAPRAFFLSMASPMVQEANPVMSWYMTPHAREVMWRAAATEPARSELLRLADRLGIDAGQAASRLNAYGAMNEQRP